MFNLGSKYYLGSLNSDNYYYSLPDPTPGRHGGRQNVIEMQLTLLSNFLICNVCLGRRHIGKSLIQPTNTYQVILTGFPGACKDNIYWYHDWSSGHLLGKSLFYCFGLVCRNWYYRIHSVPHVCFLCLCLHFRCLGVKSISSWFLIIIQVKQNWKWSILDWVTV